jgi:hypothetical protein
MYKKTVDSPVAVLERMYKHKPARSCCRRRTDRIDVRVAKVFHHSHPSVHQISEILGFGTNKIDVLSKVTHRLTDEALHCPPSGSRIAWINYLILKSVNACGSEVSNLAALVSAATKRSVRFALGTSPSIAKEDFVSFVYR